MAKEKQAVTESTPRKKPKQMVGIVVSDKMQKTVVVKVERQVKEKLYGKYVRISDRYQAHDEKNDARVGDQVALVEARPLSKTKRWAISSVLRRSALSQVLER